MAVPGAGAYGNWLGLLRWSLKQSDGTVPSEVKPMSEEDKAFLQRVFDDMTVDETKRMAELVNGVVTVVNEECAALAAGGGGGGGAAAAAAAATTTAPPIAPVVYAGAPGGGGGGGGAAGDSRLSEAAAAAEATVAAARRDPGAVLEELQDLVDGIDNAKNFIVIGAYEPLLEAAGRAELTSSLGARGLTIATRIADVIATALSNNPKAQAWALELDTLPVLAGLASRAAAGCAAACGSDAPAAVAARWYDLQASVVTALGALVRSSAAGEAAMLTAVGGSTPLDLLLAPLAGWPAHVAAAGTANPAAARGRRLVRKATVLVRHLATGTAGDAVKTALCSRPTVRSLLAALAARAPAGAEDTDGSIGDVREQVVAILLALVQKSEYVAGVVDDSDSRQRGATGKMQEVLAVGRSAPAGGAGGGGGGAAGGTAVAAAAAAAAATTPGAAAAGAPAVLLLGDGPTEASVAAGTAAATVSWVTPAAALAARFTVLLEPGVGLADALAGHAGWAAAHGDEVGEEEASMLRTLTARVEAGRRTLAAAAPTLPAAATTAATTTAVAAPSR